MAGIAWASLTLVPACSLLPIGGQPTAAPGGYPSPVGEGLREFRAVFHCHGYLSHDSDGTTAEIVAAARALGIDAVFFSDHYAPGNVAAAPRGLYGGVLIVPGIELKAYDGSSVLAFAPHRDFAVPMPSLEQCVRQLAEDGAFLVAGHVERLDEDRDLRPFEGFEIYNLHAELLATPYWLTALRALLLGVDDLLDLTVSAPRAALARWDRALQQRRFVPIAGHDAHANIQILGTTIGTYAEVFRLFSTRILAPKLGEAELLEALRAGRVWVSFDCVADGRGFALWYDDVTLGGETRWRPGELLHVKTPQPARIRIVQVGGGCFELYGDDVALALPQPGVYRVECWLEDELWIVSSPIWLR